MGGRAIHVQKYYMRQPRDLYMGFSNSVLYFPEKRHKQLDPDEIIEILDQAKARNPEWHEAMVNANINISNILRGFSFLF
jgi:hypothetical protein